MVAFASSLDQAGVLARSAEDAALLLGAMAGFDPRDSTSVDSPVPDYAAGLSQPLAGVSVGIIREFFGEGLEPRVGRLVEEAIEVLRAAGAVFLGKLNMHESAYGGKSAVTHYAPVRNAWDLKRTPGRSSGGSAAAVAARLCAGALGTDTAASIRFPAALCGVVALKATHGLASIRGIVPLSESHDHVGPLF